MVNHHPQPRNNWAQAGRFLFGTWQRAMVTIAIIIVLVLTGVVQMFIDAIFANILIPIAVVAALVAIIRHMMFGGNNRRGR